MTTTPVGRDSSNLAEESTDSERLIHVGPLGGPCWFGGAAVMERQVSATSASGGGGCFYSRYIVLIYGVPILVVGRTNKPRILSVHHHEWHNPCDGTCSTAPWSLSLSLCIMRVVTWRHVAAATTPKTTRFRGTPCIPPAVSRSWTHTENQHNSRSSRVVLVCEN